MAKPYSLDLREQAVACVTAGESVRSVAVVLQLSALGVVKWSPDCFKPDACQRYFTNAGHAST
jgi:hypothetical protein